MRVLMQRIWVAVILSAVVVAASSTRGAQQAEPVDQDAALDRILDTYVRDGYVYYNALKAGRAALDRYVASLDVAPERVARMTENDRRAFWVNAYNALVLRTVINAYPINGKAAAYPPKSVAQLPGVFDKVKHRVAGQVLTVPTDHELTGALRERGLMA